MAKRRPSARTADIGRLRRIRVWWRKEARPIWRDVHWVVIGLAAVVALGLGYLGFEYHPDADESRSVADKLYLSLQLFALESGNVAAPVPWELEVARVLAPLVAVYAAVSAVAALLREQLQLLRLRFMSEHVVVCGLGGRGLMLAKGFNERGDDVVAIEKEDDARGIGECREEGIAVLIGDAADRAVLRKARAGRARYLIAVGPDDGVNAEVAADLPELIPGRRRGKLTAFVHVTDPKLAGLLRQKASASAAAGSYTLEFFSVHEMAARALVSEYLSMGSGDGAVEAPRGMVIVGVGQLGEALAVHAANTWAAARGESEHVLPITIVDDDAGRKAESLLDRYAILKTVCRLAEEPMDIKEAKFSKAEFLLDAAKRPASVVFICLGDDALALRAAQALLPAANGHHIPVVVRMSQHAGLATLLDVDSAAGGSEGLRVFPLLERTSTPELLLHG